MMKTTRLFVALCLLATMAATASAAETVSVYVTGASQGWIQGDSTKTSLGRENSIEATYYSHMLFAEPDPRSGITGTVRDHFPITIVKRLDKATPNLMTAWQNHERLTVIFKFFRPNPSGDGTTQQFYTVTIDHAYIAGIRREVPDAIDPVSASNPPVERISFTYGGYSEVWVPTGVSSATEWTKNMTKVPLCDVNFDGVVNMKDFAILANEWLDSY
jgi:type VI secretion system secreted protein Hcp